MEFKPNTEETEYLKSFQEQKPGLIKTVAANYEAPVPGIEKKERDRVALLSIKYSLLKEKYFTKNRIKYYKSIFGSSKEDYKNKLELINFLLEGR